MIVEQLRKALSIGFVGLLVWSCYAPAVADTRFPLTQHGLFRFPDVSGEKIVFAYASDLWLVAKEGGNATRLTSETGEELHPKFSPDGRYVAFTAPYGDGNQDIYVMPIDGGTPFRVTYHPSFDRLIDWSPDGKSLLFASDRESYRNRFSQLYVVSVEGGLPEKLPVPYGEMATFSPDGDAIIYSYLKDFQNQPDFNRETWKGYRGGRAPDLWYYHLGTKQSRRLTTHDAPDSAAMWTEKGLYFLSERGGNVSNLWHLDIETDARRQVTNVENYDVTRPSFGPQDIVFERAGKLSLMRLSDEMVTEVPISLVIDTNALRPVLREAQDRLVGASLSLDGNMAILQARGELLIADLKTGVLKNYGYGSASAERFPSLSPDGKSLAYMSDQTGEYQLHVQNLETRATEVLTKFTKGYRYQPHWAPDGSKIAFIDNEQSIFVLDVKTGKQNKIDAGLWRYNWGLEAFTPSWSPDGRWLAYDRGLDNRNHAIFLFDTKKSALHQITSGMYDDHSPVFGKDGKNLYLLSARTFDPVFSDIDFTWAYANSTSIAVIPLAKESEKEDDDFNIGNMESRLELLKAPAGNYAGLKVGGDKLVYVKQDRSGTGGRGATVYFYDIEKNKETKIVSGGFRGFDVAADKVLLKKRNDLFVVSIAGDQKLAEPVDLSTLVVNYDRQQENKQILADAWRYERDFYYDPSLHGANWGQIKSKYEALLPYVLTDDDMSFLIREMAGELAGGHVWAVAVPRKRYSYRNTGLLGVNFELDKGHFRISKIIDAGAHRDDHRSPLKKAGLDVLEGTYLLAVNGRVLDSNLSPWAAFAGLADKTVELLLNDKPTTRGARTIEVKTLSSEAKLRELAWVEENRQKVTELSGGKLGYIYVPDTSLNGQNELMRQYRSQFTKKGLLVDERFNSGGALGDRLVELLNRPPLVYFSNRGGRDYPLPELSHYGPKALLINGWSYSGGDGFPLLFKAAKVGPLIGTRTWGGLIGPAASMPFVSGGRIAAPPQRVYSTEASWPGANGVVPDHEVENDPGLMVQGRDPQLEYAVENLLSRLGTYSPHKKPAYETAVELN